MRDFSLAQFLERFSFKNPKKQHDDKPASLVKAMYNRPYTSSGSRALSVNQLTSTNCTEEERFIFEFLERKRERRAVHNLDNETEDEFHNKHAVDDDEFDAYLDSLSGAGSSKKRKKRQADIDEDEEDLDFLTELGDDLKADGKKRGKKSVEDADAEEADWDSDKEDDDDGM